MWIVGILFAATTNVCVVQEAGAWWGTAAGMAVGAFCTMMCILIDTIEENR